MLRAFDRRAYVLISVAYMYATVVKEVTLAIWNR